MIVRAFGGPISLSMTGLSDCFRALPDMIHDSWHDSSVGPGGQAFLFRPVPGVPAANRWSKLGPCADIILVAMLCHNVFTYLFLTLSCATDAEVSADMDPALVSTLGWSAVQGIRIKTSSRMLIDPATKGRLIILSLVIEPLRMLSAYWMRRAREVILIYLGGWVCGSLK
jgi:hypothetical protein